MTQKQLIDQFCKYRGKCTTDDVIALNFAYKMLTPRWISVEDELPPCNVFVLTCDGQENVNLLMLGGNGRWYDKAVGLHRNITHWMPLPAISCSEKPNNHFIDANKKVDRVIGTADHIKTALDVMKEGGEE